MYFIWYFSQSAASLEWTFGNAMKLVNFLMKTISMQRYSAKRRLSRRQFISVIAACYLCLPRCLPDRKLSRKLPFWQKNEQEEEREQQMALIVQVRATCKLQVRRNKGKNKNLPRLFLHVVFLLIVAVAAGGKSSQVKSCRVECLFRIPHWPLD